ncbi:MAG: adenylate/guanylate cyclase domain-containing protein [Kiloniellales bacterium]|nr:adenylate/guanylate cyclase domain-containing protein [Kiloniellales bacterium]
MVPILSKRTPALASKAQTRDLPIVVALMAGFGLLVLIAVAAVFVAGYQVARLNTIELTRDKAELVIHSIEQHVRGHLDPVARQLSYLGAQIGANRDLASDPEALGRLLLSSSAAVPQVSVVAFVDPQLQVLRAFRNRADQPLLRSDWSDDPSVGRMLRSAAAVTEPQWGELFVAEESGTTYVNLLLPVRAEERAIGTLIAGISVRGLSAFLDRLDHPTSENAFILYGRDQVLAHRRLLADLPQASDSHPLPNLAEIADPVLPAIWSPDQLSGIEAHFANDVEAHVAEVEGERYAYLYRELTGYGAQPWLIGTYLPLRDIAPQFERLRIVLEVGAGVLVAALLMAYLLGRGISRPIREFASATRRVGNLELEAVPELSRGPFREVNETASAYNAMVGSLRLFKRYVPRALVRRLIQQEQDAEIQSVERDMTVLFTDIVGFTAMAERLPAPAVAEMLNRHFTLVDRCIQLEGGTLDKYIGDAAMAFWGAPDEQPDHAARACRAAATLAHALKVENEHQAARGHERLRVRIGIHSGPVVVGNIGAPSRINYTVIGDTVNTAERLERRARDLAPPNADVFVLVSKETAMRAGPGFAFKRVGNCQLLGRQEPVAAFALRTEPHGVAPLASDCLKTASL